MVSRKARYRASEGPGAPIPLGSSILICTRPIMFRIRADREPPSLQAQRGHRSLTSADWFRFRITPHGFDFVARLLDASDSCLETLQVQINNRSNVECQYLRNHQATNYREPQRTPGLSPGTGADSNRQSAKERSHRRHHDRPKTFQATLINSLFWREVVFALRFN